MKIKVDGDLVIFNFASKDCDCTCDCEKIVDECTQQEQQEQEECRTYYDEFLDFCQNILKDRVDFFIETCDANSPFITSWCVDLYSMLKIFATVHSKVLDWSKSKNISDWLNSPYEDEGTEEDNSNED